MFPQLKEKLKSNIKALEILALIKGNKAGARILVREDDAKAMCDFLDGIGIQTVSSDFKVLKTDAGAYSDAGEKTKADDARKGYYVFYLSKDRSEAEKIKALEERNDHYNLGIALGYPECCCRFFRENFSEKNTDLTLSTLGNSNGFRFDFRSNIAMRHFDVSLLFHFPCSFKCKESMKIAKENLRILGGEDRESAKIFEGMLKGAVIYGASNVILLRRARLDGKKIYYNGLMALNRNALYRQLKESGHILVNSHGSFKVGNTEYSGIGIAYFE
ncbi:hypothetical protein HY638_01115 [Candidatus Woesearchaeota archaeon]|nr:hypothetical protein [Candidatus Woesearchaeota archaeon]